MQEAINLTDEEIELRFNMTAAEATLIVNALAQLQFALVAGLIGKLQSQAASQKPSPQGEQQ